jgi:hypothetical protein
MDHEPEQEAGRMTSDPLPPRAGTRPATQRVVAAPSSSPGPLIGAVVTLVLGACLGIADQSAAGTPMGLRVPALLAALLGVGQGVVDLARHWPKRRVVETEVILENGEGVRSRELAVVRPIPPQKVVTAATTRPTTATLAVPVSVMALAIWLGIADISIKSTSPTLTALSLIGSFALFALGWSLLPARR